MSYPGAHLAITNLSTGTRSFSNEMGAIITGAISVTVDWTALNDLAAENIQVMFCEMTGEGMTPTGNYNFSEFTSPHTFSRSDMGSSYSSLFLAFQVYSYMSAPDAIFVLNSLEVIYDCIS